MRTLKHIMVMLVAALVSANALASIASRAQQNQPVVTRQQPVHPAQPIAQAKPVVKQPSTNLAPLKKHLDDPKLAIQSANDEHTVYESGDPATEPKESVLPPGATVVSGDPDKNEFFVVDEKKHVPQALVTYRQKGDERVNKAQIAVEEAKETVEQMEVPKLQSLFGNSKRKIDSRGEASKTIKAVMEISNKTAEANDGAAIQSEQAAVNQTATDVTPVTPTAEAATQASKTLQPKGKTAKSHMKKHQPHHLIAKHHKTEMHKAKVHQTTDAKLKRDLHMQSKVAKHESKKVPVKVSIDKTDRHIVYNHHVFKVKSIKAIE